MSSLGSDYTAMAPGKILKTRNTPAFCKECSQMRLASESVLGSLHIRGRLPEGEACQVHEREETGLKAKGVRTRKDSHTERSTEKACLTRTYPSTAEKVTEAGRVERSCAMSTNI